MTSTEPFSNYINKEFIKILTLIEPEFGMRFRITWR